MRVICISGKAQHGKDTAANILKSCLETYGERVLITHYADLLKYICKAFFGWNGVKDENGRRILQYVGTDVIRTKAPDYWVDFIIGVLTIFQDKWDWVLIPDTRFPNELYRMAERFNTLHLRIVRPNLISPLTVAQQNHPSETALDDTVPDLLLENSGDIHKLEETINTWIKETFYESKS